MELDVRCSLTVSGVSYLDQSSLTLVDQNRSGSPKIHVEFNQFQVGTIFESVETRKPVVTHQGNVQILCFQVCEFNDMEMRRT